MHSFYGTRLSENMAETPEGYLICYDVKIARIGTQDYLGSELGVDDDVVKVNRPAEEVFKPATVASFEGKPFTNDHPYNLLDVNNTPIYEKGHVQNVRVSDDKIYLIADIMVKDSQTIQDIKNGKRELSAGYNCDCLQDKDGNWYQANIIGNHVALVDKGRAGEKVRINDEDWKESDHPRDKDGKFTSGGGSGESSSSEKPKGNTSSNPVSSLSEKERRGIDIALTMYGQEYQKRGNEGTYKASQEIREKVKNGEELSSEDIKSIQIALNATGAEEAKEIANKLGGETSKEKSGGRLEEAKEVINRVKETTQDLINLLKNYPENSKESESLLNAINSNLASINKIKLEHNIKDQDKEKPMKDSKSSVLGKLLKAFAKDAEPEEMVEALEAVKGKEDEEPDRLTKLETMVQDLCARMDAYDEATKQEAPEITALDEVEKELEDEEPEKKEEELEDEDLNNDPKLIEAQKEKAQSDEDTTEEIKKEVADAKKVIAKIADKETRLAVADSLASIIRGKIKYSDNYKKLMDASNKKPAVKDSKVIDYKAVFKKIKEDKFRK